MKCTKIFKICFVLILLIFSQQVYAIENIISLNENAKLSIADCINIALRNNPVLQGYKYNWMIAKHNVSISKSAYVPTITIGAGIDKYYDRIAGASSSSSNFPSIQARLRELIWDFGKTFANIKMEKFNLLAAKYDYENASWLAMYDVKVCYYKALAAKASLEVEKYNVKMNERNCQRVQAYFDEGIRSRIDVVNAEANLSDANVKLITAEKLYKQSIIDLNNSMYIINAPNYELMETDSFDFSVITPPRNLLLHDYTKIIETPQNINDARLTSSVQKANIIGHYTIPEFAYSFDECVKLADEYRCDLQVLKQTVNVMQEALKVTKRQYLPALVGDAGYGFNRYESINQNSFNIGLSLETSLNPMRTKHEIDIGKIKILRAQNEVDTLSKDIYFNLQRYFVEMREYEKEIPVMFAKVQQTLENLELADGRYEVGLADYIELQDARVKYNNAQINYIATVFNYNIARAKLEQTVALPPNGTSPFDLDKEIKKKLK